MKRKKRRTCSIYFCWRRIFDAHLRHEFGISPGVGNKTWLTIIECVSICHLANSWTNLSVSYNDKNSGIQTQINVVKFFEKTKISKFVFQLKSNQQDFEIVP